MLALMRCLNVVAVVSVEEGGERGRVVGREEIISRVRETVCSFTNSSLPAWGTFRN